MNASGIPSPVSPSTQAAPPHGPLSFGQILDRIFRLVRANLGPFAGIGSLPAGFVALLYLAMIGGMLAVVQPWHTPNPAAIPPRIGLFFVVLPVVYVLLLLIFALYQPAAVYGALQADAGARVSVRGAWSLALKKAGRYIWLMILSCLIVAGPIVLLAAIVAGTIGLALASGKNPFDSGAGLLLIPLAALLYIGAMVYSVIAALWVSLACPACVAEDLPARAAISRSFRLTRGAKGRLFLLLLVIYAISYAGIFAVEMVFLFLGSLGALVFVLLHIPLKPWGFAGIGVAGIVLLAAVFFWMVVTWSAYFTAFAVVYRDQRQRMERAAAADTIATPAP
ncbi:MAG: hypothetical protein ABSF23_03625 [Terracidiphilus sp.]|jgi:uncharacterized membrane protein